MSLEKQVVIDQIEVTELGCVQIRQATKIMEDGIELSRLYHRHVINPGDDYSNEDARVQAICQVVHTEGVIDAYKLSIKKISKDL